MPYKSLGLKCGIEIHQQLEGKKLFCSCPTQIRDDEPHFEITRFIRASAGEGGKIDVAAAQEQQKQKTFIYQGYDDTTCLVETDSEPPHELNAQSLYTSLQLCKLTHSNISPVVQVMRKTIVDGSNVSGFQRTALIARGGQIETDEGTVRIENVSLEEDACKIVENTPEKKVYRLDRLGIPLIEIGTAPDIKTPQQAQQAARKIGMLLRSLPGVKRGLGTIRQDVNVSIKGGTRIEIKGAQDLRQIPLLVELEAKRQVELIKLKERLESTTLNEFQIHDLTQLLNQSQSKVLRSALDSNGVILALKLDGFMGLVGRELQPNYRLGTEFSGRAKIKAGVRGIFHSDELPNYGITQEEVDQIKQQLQTTDQDAFILVASSKERATKALEAVYERAQELWTGVPKEVRKANPDGTSSYLRPMPTAARMYPETDVPLIKPDTQNIELPELLEDKAKRFEHDYKLSHDVANFMVKSPKVNLFEELAKQYPNEKPAFIAATLTSTLKDIKKQYQKDPTKLTDQHFKDVFKHLDEDKIHKDIIIDVLLDMIQDKFDLKNYESLGTEQIHQEIKKIIDENKGAPFPALMGMCMKQLAGKASGKFISQELKRIMSEGHK